MIFVNCLPPRRYPSEKGGDTRQDILSAIGNVGFPMAVTAFLLVRIEAKLAQLNHSILLLTRTIAQK